MDVPEILGRILFNHNKREVAVYQGKNEYDRHAHGHKRIKKPSIMFPLMRDTAIVLGSILVASLVIFLIYCNIRKHQSKK